MNQLSKIIIAHALAVGSIFGLGFKVDAQMPNLETQTWENFSSTDTEPIQIAQMYSQKRSRNWGEGLQKVLDRLDLSQEQSSQIKAIYRRHYQTNRESRNS